jgi:hypothetical protein
MNRPLIGLGLIGTLILAGAFAQPAAADDPVLDPADPPVRLKKKNRPVREKKSEPPRKDDAKKNGETTPAAPDPDKPVRPKIDEAKKPVPKKPVEDERKKIVERILKNLDKAEQKLAKNDPGRATREIQRDIVKDLDRLIEQTRNQQPPQGGSSSSRSRSRKSQQKPNSMPRSSGSQKNNGKAGRNDPKEGKSKGNGEGGNTNNPADKSGMGGKGGKKENSKLNDLFKDVWGHLPETLRQEMDAYARAKFLPEYDLALRQYYRTLSEQGRKK